MIRPDLIGSSKWIIGDSMDEILCREVKDLHLIRWEFYGIVLSEDNDEAVHIEDNASEEVGKG